MAAAYQAVILAAGQGSRLHEHTRQIPKPILPIGPRSLEDQTQTSFLRRQVEILTELGVADVVVVVGALKEMVIEHVSGWDMSVTLVVNDTPEMDTSGSLHSFQYAVHASHGVLDGTRQTLLMDADIVYHRDALRLLLEAPEKTTMLVSERFTGDSEEVRVYGKPLPRFLGKALTEELVDGEPCLGEAAGIVKFAPADHELARRTIDWVVGDPHAEASSLRHRGYGPAGKATEHEELTQRFMRYGRMACACFGEHVPFMECDDPGEYKELRESFYPRLLRMEAGQEDAS